MPEGSLDYWSHQENDAPRSDRGRLLIIINIISLSFSILASVVLIPIAEPDYPSLAPLFWLIGYGVIFFFQLSCSILPSLYFFFFKKATLHTSTRKRILITSLIGAILPFATIAGVLIYDLFRPHRPWHGGG